MKQGKGPVYAQRMAELATLNDQYKIKGERAKDAQKRLAATETRIAQIERELSTIDGDLAKMKGEAQTSAAKDRARLEATTAGLETQGRADSRAPMGEDHIEPAAAPEELSAAAFPGGTAAEPAVRLYQTSGWQVRRVFSSRTNGSSRLLMTRHH